ncbi:hypothetical protein REPUB_Repub12eG0139000 [Reevesia pubescens]
MESASSASKKRKISHDDDDEDDEEEKMEKFYALIKSIREARDGLIMNKTSAQVVNKEVADHQSERKRKLEEEKQVGVRKPSFQREDFLEDSEQLKKPPALKQSFASTSQTEEGANNDHKEEVKQGLDLTLSL